VFERGLERKGECREVWEGMNKGRSMAWRGVYIGNKSCHLKNKMKTKLMKI
jgi:hypothetical protein